MSQDDERASMRAAVETGAVSVGEYVAKYGSEPTPNDTPHVPEIDLTQFEGIAAEKWEAVRSDPAEGYDVWWLYSGEGKEQKEIATISGWDPHDKREARARLIAAAPDLLAAYRAALARIEVAEKARDRYATLYGSAFKALTDAERQRDEAWTAGAEAMREACAQASEGEAYGFPPEQLTEHGQGYDRACKEIAAILRALPIPAQEK